VLFLEHSAKGIALGKEKQPLQRRVTETAVLRVSLVTLGKGSIFVERLPGNTRQRIIDKVWKTKSKK
jgi:hypothetical protein